MITKTMTRNTWTGWIFLQMFFFFFWEMDGWNKINDEVKLLFHSRKP